MKEKLQRNREEVDQVMSRAFKPKKKGYDPNNGRLVDYSFDMSKNAAAQ